MRIVEMNPFYLPYNGGIEKRIRAICSGLAKRHEVFVLTSRLPGTPATEEMDGATVIRLRSTYRGNYNPPFVSSEGILPALSDIGPDVVDYHYRWSGSYNRAFFRYTGRRVVTFHNQFGEGTGLLGIASRMNDLLYIRRMHGLQVMTVSAYVKKQLAYHGIREDDIEVIPNGIDRRTMATDDGGFALFIGRLVSTKGIERLVEACIQYGIPLKIAGTGPLMMRLKKASSGNGNIELLGHVSEEEKEHLLSTCSYFVMPSLQEAFGIAILEAMAHGKAVIAGNVGGVSEVVGNAGMLIDPTDKDELASALIRLWRDDEKRRMLGRMAYGRAAQFMWDEIVKRIEKLYMRVLDGSRTDA
ncbi:MAG: glycosyltransferase family 4 protein [Thermoplasmata archaeon YP2-bin.285]|uniref:Glycosyltransferase family 4 protein n=1 Tax=Candidatus Sysuiplasma superficiale TaxID=2823368 RepID=A0A8J8CBA9_9ARCH|nr:glycosyltransferase family 4 protein [Candidatus Sysuiplasma superficiale]